MRLLKLSAAIALMAGSFGLTATAEAQHYDPHHRVEHREVRRDHYRRDDRRYRRPLRAATAGAGRAIAGWNGATTAASASAAEPAPPRPSRRGASAA